MDTPRQVLRYTVPGLVLLLYGASCFILIRLIGGVSLSVAKAPIANNLEPVGGVAISIALGVVVYQLYSLSYGPFFLRRRFVKADRGRAVLLQLLPEQVEVVRRFYKPDLDLTLRHRITSLRLLRRLRLLELDPMWRPAEREGTSPDRRDRYAADWYEHWHIVCALVDLVATGAGRDHKAEYTTLSDVYHMLGAIRTAFALGGTGAVVAVVVRNGFGTVDLRSIAGVGVAMTMTTALCVVFHRSRALTEKSATRRLGLGLRGYFADHPETLEHLASCVGREAAVSDVSEADDLRD